MQYYIYNNDELYHYGVKGIKWGVRRAKQTLPTSDTRRQYDSAKSDYKAAKKAYKKSFNKASNYSSLHPITQFTSKKKAAESDRRWDDAIDKAGTLDKAQSKYTQAKRERRQRIADTKDALDKQASLGEKLVFNDATRKKAAKYVVDNGMSMEEANKRAKTAAIRNTAAYIGAFGAITVASLYMQNR